MLENLRILEHFGAFLMFWMEFFDSPREDVVCGQGKHRHQQPLSWQEYGLPWDAATWLTEPEQFKGVISGFPPQWLVNWCELEAYWGARWSWWISWMLMDSCTLMRQRPLGFAHVSCQGATQGRREQVYNWDKDETETHKLWQKDVCTHTHKHHKQMSSN